MAVEVVSPDARKKVDELFLYWLSEPSTQELLRQELARVCGLQQQKMELLSPTYNHRPRLSTSNVRAVTPPPSPSTSPSRSPKSPQTTKSKHVETVVTPTAQEKNILIGNGVEETDGGKDLLVQPISKTEGISTAVLQSTTNHFLKSPSINMTSPPHLMIKSEPVPIPQFYFPRGKPKNGRDEKLMIKVERIFQRYHHHEIAKRDFHHVLKALNLPLYWKAPLFKACISGKNKKTVSIAGFKKVWTKIIEQCHDDASRFMQILSLDQNRDYLIEEDFEILVQDIVDNHPGLEFLREAPEFHARYMETVIGRIFYTVDKSWKGRITLHDLRNSNFLQTISRLEHEDDINKITDYFSYEHFYVIYCKFWELDTDHDLLIDVQDLSRHCDRALNIRIVDQLMSGVVTRDKSTPIGQMKYKDFVWFLLSEEDKTTSRSIEYWFRVLDKDGDGVLSLYELEYFYEEILIRLEEMNIESLSLENTVCQVLDMINPKETGKILLSDLKKSKLTPLFLNTFVNIEKYLDNEQRELQPTKDDDDVDKPSDWERYAAEQYEILVADEQCDEDEENEEMDYDDDMMDTDVVLQRKDLLSVSRAV